ncbi:hypothetical protein [Gilvibacter sediminis]|uniref:hypothetical protein n=1 Tax=Gilvibacter sediminis TaxID=379071 RepID=UPI00234FF7CE|nr:hypothetical protein [Gilvibacter sediminis]MDC7997047.1 hypothetical protein [Gilvibacter sediminis]
MSRFLLILCTLLCSLTATAQIETIKDVDASALEVLQVDVDNIARLTVRAGQTDRFKAFMNTEGEFAQELVLNIFETGGTWSVNIGFAPGFLPTDDKLGAHKVISAELTLEIPEGKYLNVSGRCLRVALSGGFSVVELRLDGGNIDAKNFLASGVLETLDGNVRIKGRTGLFAETVGQPDKIANELPQSGTHFIRVVSPQGSINLKAKN